MQAVALKAVYNETGGNTTLIPKNWFQNDSSDIICSFDVNECDITTDIAENVTLSEFGMSETIPDEIYLPHPLWSRLDMSNNNLTGTVSLEILSCWEVRYSYFCVCIASSNVHGFLHNRSYLIKESDNSIFGTIILLIDDCAEVTLSNSGGRSTISQIIFDLLLFIVTVPQSRVTLSRAHAAVCLVIDIFAVIFFCGNLWRHNVLWRCWTFCYSYSQTNCCPNQIYWL